MLLVVAPFVRCRKRPRQAKRSNMVRIRECNRESQLFIAWSNEEAQCSSRLPRYRALRPLSQEPDAWHLRKHRQTKNAVRFRIHAGSIGTHSEQNGRCTVWHHSAHLTTAALRAAATQHLAMIHHDTAAMMPSSTRDRCAKGLR